MNSHCPETYAESSSTTASHCINLQKLLCQLYKFIGYFLSRFHFNVMSIMKGLGDLLICQLNILRRHTVIQHLFKLMLPFYRTFGTDVSTGDFRRKHSTRQSVRCQFINLLCADMKTVQPQIAHAQVELCITFCTMVCRVSVRPLFFNAALCKVCEPAFGGIRRARLLHTLVDRCCWGEDAHFLSMVTVQVSNFKTK